MQTLSVTNCLTVGVLICAALCAAQLPCTVVVPPALYPGGSCVIAVSGVPTDSECSRIEKLFASATGVFGGDLYIYQNNVCGVAVRAISRVEITHDWPAR